MMIEFSPVTALVVLVFVAGLIVLVRRLASSSKSDARAPSSATLVSSLLTAAPVISDAERLAAEQLQRYRDLIARGEPLPVLRTASSGDACYSAETSAYVPTGEFDGESGRVDITDKGLFFTGIELRLTCPWSRVLTIELEPSTLFVHLTNKTKPIEIDYGSRPEAELAHLIALTIWRRNPDGEVKGKRRRAAKKEAQPVAAADEKPVGTTIELQGAGGFRLAIVGESYRQTALKTLAGDRRERGEEVIFTAALVPEPSNQYDPNAIKVCIHGGQQIGYFAKGDAAEYVPVSRALLARHAVGLCRARLIGGTLGKPSIGVQLDLAEPSIVVATLSDPSEAF
jgi:hypothetical protein